MLPQIDRKRWSGEGDFTQTLLDWLAGREHVVFLRVEDSEASRSDVEYNFLSNEIFVGFRSSARVEWNRMWGVLPWRRTVTEQSMTFEELTAALTDDETIDAPDHADDGMIQFLHTERVIPPYQTKGYKLIELVRIYEVGTPSRAGR